MKAWWNSKNRYTQGMFIGIFGFLVIQMAALLPGWPLWLFVLGFIIFMLGFGMMAVYKFGGQEQRDYEESIKAPKQPWEG